MIEISNGFLRGILEDFNKANSIHFWVKIDPRVSTYGMWAYWTHNKLLWSWFEFSKGHFEITDKFVVFVEVWGLVTILDPLQSFA